MLLADLGLLVIGAPQELERSCCRLVFLSSVHTDLASAGFSFCGRERCNSQSDTGGIKAGGARSAVSDQTRRYNSATKESYSIYHLFFLQMLRKHPRNDRSTLNPNLGVHRRIEFIRQLLKPCEKR